MAQQRREQTRHRAVVPVANEQGFIMVMALMMLVVLSLMATAAMSVRNTELAIVRNTETVLSNFFGVEAVTLEGATVLENIDKVASDKDALSKLDEPSFNCTTVDPNSDVLPNRLPDTLCWLQPNAAGTIKLRENADWHNAGTMKPEGTVFNGGDRNITPAGYAADGTVNGDRIWYAAVQGNLNSDSTSYQICRGSDLSDPTKVEKCYSVYGMYDVKSGAGKAYPGRRMMMVGYKKTVVSN